MKKALFDIFGQVQTVRLFVIRSTGLMLTFNLIYMEKKHSKVSLTKAPLKSFDKIFNVGLINGLIWVVKGIA